MTYNRKKAMQKKAEAVPQNREHSLQEYNKDWGYSLPDSTTNLNGLLADSRGKGDSPDQTIEALMDAPRKEAHDSDSRTTEGQLEERESYQVHRDSEHFDKAPMSPVNAHSGAADAKFQKAYAAKVETAGKTRLVDRDPGSQMIGPKTRVIKNIPENASQLTNHPSRFASSDREKMVLATLYDADKVLFNIYYKAASEKRELTENERTIEAQITEDKRRVMAQMPPVPAQKPQPEVPPSNPHHPHGDVSSEFFPQSLPGESPTPDPLGEPVDEAAIDDALIDQMLGGTPAGGIAGEDVLHPNYDNIHLQEQQEIDMYADEDNEGMQPRF